MLAEQVEVPPSSRLAVGHRIEECLAVGGIGDLLQLLGQVEIIPADDTVLDEPLAGFGHLLVFFLGLQEFPGVAHRDGAREAVYMLNPIQLLFDERGMRSYRRALGQVFSRIRGRTPLLVEIQLEVIPMNPQGPSAPYLPSNG